MRSTGDVPGQPPQWKRATMRASGSPNPGIGRPVRVHDEVDRLRAFALAVAEIDTALAAGHHHDHVHLAAAQGGEDGVPFPAGGTEVAVVIPGRLGHVTGQQHAPGQLRLEQVFDQTRHGGTELARLHGLLCSTRQALAPLHGQLLAFRLGQRIRTGILPADVTVAVAAAAVVALVLIEWPPPRRPAGFLLFVVEMLVVGLILHIVLDIGVDLLRHHALEAAFQKNARGWLEPVFQQQWIDRQVTGDIPAVLDAMLATRKVGQSAVQRFVGKHKLRLLQRQSPDVLGVVVQRPHVGANGLAAIRFGRLHGQAQYQRAEEGPIQYEAGACGAEFGFDFV